MYLLILCSQLLIDLYYLLLLGVKYITATLSYQYLLTSHNPFSLLIIPSARHNPFSILISLLLITIPLRSHNPYTLPTVPLLSSQSHLSPPNPSSFLHHPHTPSHNDPSIITIPHRSFALHFLIYLLPIPPRSSQSLIALSLFTFSSRSSNLRIA